MNATASNDWHELNYSYLTIAAQQVHQLLERHADPNQVQPETATESILAAIAATMPAPPALEQLVTIFKLSSFGIVCSFVFLFFSLVSHIVIWTLLSEIKNLID